MEDLGYKALPSAAPADAPAGAVEWTQQKTLRRKQHLLLAACFLDLAFSCACFMIPERKELHFLLSAKTWKYVYDFNFSSMDLWLLSVVRNAFWLLSVATTWRRMQKSRYGAPVSPISESLPSFLFVLAFFSYFFFFAKLVGLIYGIFRRETAVPIDKGREAWIFLSLLAGGFATVKEHSCVKALLGLWKSKWLASISGKCPDLHEKIVKEDRESREKRDKEWRALKSLYDFAKVDKHILLVAFACGCIASLATVSISYYIGKVVMFGAHEKSKTKTHAALSKLLVAVICCALFTSIRGGLFTLSCARLNSRIRSKLLQSLLAMEQGYFDKVRTGELSSRLNTDTTQISSQISLNINVLVRSLVQVSLPSTSSG